MKEDNRSAKNRKTRMKIGEAIIYLLEREKLEEIKISKIIKLVGVSRMTFYHYYETKEEALMDYLSELIIIYRKAAKENGADSAFGSEKDLSFALKFFAQFDNYMLRLQKSNCYNILIDGLNKYLEDNYSSEFNGSIYSLYFYGGALLNVFMKWIAGGQKESAEEIARLIIADYGIGRLS